MLPFVILRETAGTMTVPSTVRDRGCADRALKRRKPACRDRRVFGACLRNLRIWQSGKEVGKA